MENRVKPFKVREILFIISICLILSVFFCDNAQAASIYDNDDNHLIGNAQELTGELENRLHGQTNYHNPDFFSFTLEEETEVLIDTTYYATTEHLGYGGDFTIELYNSNNTSIPFAKKEFFFNRNLGYVEGRAVCYLSPGVYYMKLYSPFSEAEYDISVLFEGVSTLVFNIANQPDDSYAFATELKTGEYYNGFITEAVDDKDYYKITNDKDTQYTLTLINNGQEGHGFNFLLGAYNEHGEELCIFPGFTLWEESHYKIKDYGYETINVTLPKGITYFEVGRHTEDGGQYGIRADKVNTPQVNEKPSDNQNNTENAGPYNMIYIGLENNQQYESAARTISRDQSIVFETPNYTVNGYTFTGWKLTTVTKDNEVLTFLRKKGLAKWVNPSSDISGYEELIIRPGTKFDLKMLLENAKTLYVAACWKKAETNNDSTSIKDEEQYLVNITGKNLIAYNRVKLTWKTVDGAAQYKVYQKSGKSGEYICAYTIEAASGSRQSATITKVPGGKKVYFKVLAVDESGTIHEPEDFEEVSLYVLKKISKPKVVNNKTKAKVKFTMIAGADGYEISKSTKKTGTNIVKTIYTENKSGSKSISLTAKKGKTYYYKVRAFEIVDDKKIYSPWSEVYKFKR